MVVPGSTRLATSMVAPCNSTRWRTSASPIPLPSIVRPPGLAGPIKAVEQLAEVAVSYPDPGVGDRDRRSPACSLADAHLDRTRERELEGVGHQVEDHRLPRVGVAGGRSMASSSPACWQTSANEDAISAVSCPRSQTRGLTLVWPAFTRAKSKRALTRRSSLSPLRCTLRKRSASSGPLDAISPSSGPSINVSGVRDSWLTLVRTSVLASSNCVSASARRRSQLALSGTDCPASGSGRGDGMPGAPPGPTRTTWRGRSSLPRTRSTPPTPTPSAPASRRLPRLAPGSSWPI